MAPSRLTGVLLTNLGTPRSPSTRDVRRYLREFLTDPQVLDGMSALTRALLVHGIIAPFRAPRSAQAYRKIWTQEGSPLRVHGRALRDALALELGEGYAVELGMRYGEPAIRAALVRLVAREPERIVVLPLFPQYAAASTGTALDRVRDVARDLDAAPPLEFAEDFYADAGFIAALAGVARPTIDEFKPDHVLMSYHGLPESKVRATDTSGAHCCVRPDCCEAISATNRRCYRAQCVATSRALALELGLAQERWSLAFQSRLGRAPWITPYTDRLIPELAGRGVKRLAVICPSFVADCLETLEEIGIRAREQWETLGGEDFHLIPCLNADPGWVAALAARLRAGAQAAMTRPL